MDGEETITHVVRDRSLTEYDEQSNGVTGSSTTLQQRPIPRHSWSSIRMYILSSFVVDLIAIIITICGVFVNKAENLQYELAQIRKELGVENQRKLDVLKAEKLCVQDKHEAGNKYRAGLDEAEENCILRSNQMKEKYRSDVDQVREKCRSDLDQVKEKYRSGLDLVKEKYRSDLDQVKENCRSEVYQAKEKHRSDMYQVKEDCRSNIDEIKEQFRSELGQAKEQHREEKAKREYQLKYQHQQWTEYVHWLIACMAGRHATQPVNMISSIISALWSALMNSDMEHCIKEFNDRYKR